MWIQSLLLSRLPNSLQVAAFTGSAEISVRYHNWYVAFRRRVAAWHIRQAEKLDPTSFERNSVENLGEGVFVDAEELKRWLDANRVPIISQRSLEMAAAIARDPVKSREFLVKAGISTPDGKLTPEYRQEEM